MYPEITRTELQDKGLEYQEMVGTVADERVEETLSEQSRQETVWCPSDSMSLVFPGVIE